MENIKNYIKVIIGIEVIILLALLGIVSLQEMQLRNMEMGSWALDIETEYGTEVWERLKDIDG